MKYPLVTIGIPTYNRADKFLKDAFKSALSQTYPNLEILVSDNCSTDNTEALINQLSDSRVRYYRHETNIGAANNFNFCVDQAKGDYFLLLHSDDLIDPDFIDSCMQAAEYSDRYGIIRTGARTIDAMGKVIKESFNRAAGLSTDEFFEAWFNNKTTFYFCCILFNTHRLREIGGLWSPQNLFQDVVAAVQLAAKFGRVDVEEPKASFRVHEGEITTSVKIKDWCDDSLYLIDLMCDLVPEKKTSIRKEGTAFLARVNYRFASRKSTLFDQLLAYWIVFKSFHYRIVPPPVSKILRRAKRLQEKIFNQ